MKYNEGDYEQAIEPLQKALDLAPNSHMAWHFLGSSLRHSGSLQDGIRCLEEARKIYPHSFDTNVELGISYQAQGDYRAAVASFEAALLELRAPTLLILLSLARSDCPDVSLHDYAQAEHLASEAVKLTGRSDFRAWMALSIALLRAGKPEEARACALRAEELARSYAEPHPLKDKLPTLLQRLGR
jgi:Flp pilus assembly protein TadD